MKAEQKSIKTGRIKIILIVVLSIIFILVAYFRFFHNESIRATNNTVVPPPAQPVQIPPAYQSGAETGKKSETLGVGPSGSGMITKNIFAPASTLPTTGESTLPAAEKAEEKAPPAFKLSGVITDDGAAMAVINGKFLKKGDVIEGYQVVRIGDKSVILSGNGQKIVLNVLTTKDK